MFFFAAKSTPDWLVAGLDRSSRQKEKTNGRATSMGENFPVAPLHARAGHPYYRRKSAINLASFVSQK